MYSIMRIRSIVYAYIGAFLIMLLVSNASFAQVSMPSYSRLDPISAIVNAPTDVALDSSGKIYIVESSLNRMLVFSQSAQYLSTLTGLYKPISVSVDTNGRIFIANKDRGNVEAYDADFNFLFKLGNGDWEFLQPNDIAIDSSGKIYVADFNDDKIKVYNSDGTFNTSYGSTGTGNGQFNYPTSITIDELAQEIIVLDRKLTQGSFGTHKGARVQVFGMDWTFQRSFGEYGDLEGQMNKPKSIAVDDQGRYYVSDSQYHIVYVYHGDCNVGGVANYCGKITNIDYPMTTPMGIALGNSYRLYISSLNTGNVEIYGVGSYTNMEVTPLSLTFEGNQYGSNPPSQDIQITNNGASMLDWTAVADEPWISVSAESGSLAASASVNISAGADISGLTPGAYSGSVTIESAAGTSETVDITLDVISDPPVADAGGPYSAYEGQVVSLDGSGSGGGLVSYQWDIDHDFITDNYIYNNAGPSQDHTYITQGEYYVKLLVTDQGAFTSETWTTATILDSVPVANFSGTLSQTPQTVDFTNLSTGYDQPLTYEWDFNNDTVVDSYDENPSYTYPSPGTYSVSLKVTDSDGSPNTLLMSNYVTIQTAYVLNVLKASDGSGYVFGASSGIDCGGDCQESVSEGSEITLSSTPYAGSVFSGWSGGGCSGTSSCTTTINNNTDITATFDICSNGPIRISDAIPSYFPTIEDAYTAAADGDIIQLQSGIFTEDTLFDENKTVVLESGYDCEYSSDSQTTILDGNTTITNGTVIIGSI